MTIATSEDRERMMERLMNKKFSLKQVNPIGYADPTPIQKDIEKIVTNGRGYCSLQQCLDIVNEYNPSNFISLSDVLKSGVIPLESCPCPETVDEFSNPCGEISLGVYEEDIMRSAIVDFYQGLSREKQKLLEPTLLDCVESIAAVKCIKYHHKHDLF